eukprot:921847-Pyramimonas_sp.AAC.1
MRGTLISGCMEFLVEPKQTLLSFLTCAQWRYTEHMHHPDADASLLHRERPAKEVIVFGARGPTSKA